MEVAKANRTKHKSWSHMPPPYLLATARRETTSALARAAAHMMKYCGPLFPRFLLFFDSGIYSWTSESTSEELWRPPARFYLPLFGLFFSSILHDIRTRFSAVFIYITIIRLHLFEHDYICRCCSQTISLEIGHFPSGYLLTFFF